MVLFLSGSLNRSLNVEIGVEYQMIFVVLIFDVLVKFILGHLRLLKYKISLVHMPHPNA